MAKPTAPFPSIKLCWHEGVAEFGPKSTRGSKWGQYLRQFEQNELSSHPAFLARCNLGWKAQNLGEKHSDPYSFMGRAYVALTYQIRIHSWELWCFLGAHITNSSCFHESDTAFKIKSWCEEAPIKNPWEMLFVISEIILGCFKLWSKPELWNSRIFSKRRAYFRKSVSYIRHRVF